MPDHNSQKLSIVFFMRPGDRRSVRRRSHRKRRRQILRLDLGTAEWELNLRSHDKERGEVNIDCLNSGFVTLPSKTKPT